MSSYCGNFQIQISLKNKQEKKLKETALALRAWIISGIFKNLIKILKLTLKPCLISVRVHIHTMNSEVSQLMTQTLLRSKSHRMYAAHSNMKP